MADDRIEPAGLTALTAGQPVAIEVIASEGVVLGSQDATPLEFWVGVREGGQLELDDLVTIETVSPRGQAVRFFGIVDVVRKRYEGAQYDTDAFRATEGLLAVDISYAAHVQVTRIDPEIFIPPHPGDRVRLVRGVEFEEALSFDRMEYRLPIGLTRTGEPSTPISNFSTGRAAPMLRSAASRASRPRPPTRTSLSMLCFIRRCSGPRRSIPKR